MHEIDPDTEVEFRFAIGDEVSFLFIDRENNHTTFVKDSTITNLTYSKTLFNADKPNTIYIKSYYFCNPSDNVQGVWIPENRVFPKNEDSVAEILFGE